MQRLTDENLAALVKYAGEKMSPKLKFLEDTFNALTELQDRRDLERWLCDDDAQDA